MFKVSNIIKKSGNNKWVNISKELGITLFMSNFSVAKATDIDESACVFNVSSNKWTCIQGSKYEWMENCYDSPSSTEWKTLLPSSTEWKTFLSAMVCEKQMNWWPGSLLKSFMPHQPGYINLRLVTASPGGVYVVKKRADFNIMFEWK